MLEKMITRKCLKKGIEIAEMKGNWGKSSKEEFANLIELALSKNFISDEEAFDLTMRAMKI